MYKSLRLNFFIDDIGVTLGLVCRARIVRRFQPLATKASSLLTVPQS